MKVEGLWTMAPVFNLDLDSNTELQFGKRRLILSHGEADWNHTGDLVDTSHWKADFEEGVAEVVAEKSAEFVVWLMGEPHIGITPEQANELGEPHTWILLQHEYDGSRPLVEKSAHRDGAVLQVTPFNAVEGGFDTPVYYHDLGLVGAHMASLADVDSILTAMRLIKESPLWCPTVMTRWEKYGAFTFYSERWESMRWDLKATRFGAKDSERLKQVVSNLAGGHATAKRFRLALSRYNAALDRSSREDGIIDLCIALEAALSTDPNVRDRGEYLEKKASALLKTRRESGNDPTIAHHYWVRNQIVHGTGATYDVQETFNALAGDVRRILFEMLMRPELIDLLSEGGPSKN
jgi:hypothetical protein